MAPPNQHKLMGSRLCKTCSVLRFNDELLAPYVAEGDSSPQLPDTDINRGQRFPLDYRVCDFLPRLPCLEQSADRGCDFCALLRKEIIRAGFDYRDFVLITLAYNWGHDTFPGVGLAALVAEVEWRPEIPSIPRSSRPPHVLRNCILFTLETEDTSVGSWLHIPRLRKEEALCDDNVRLMKRALDRCVLDCPHVDSGGFLPTRLIDLGSGASSGPVRLVLASDILGGSSPLSEVPKYAALSYCWGSPANGPLQPCTNKGNLQARKVGITEITPVLRDSIRVCRSLGLRYLWVDALCIVQDDTADWERESVSMAMVYERALVTICTPISTSCWEGFLDRDRRLVSVTFQSRLSPDISGSYSLVASGTCREKALIGWPNLDINHSIWASRGWTLQENLMSVRRLIFGQSMIHFQCGNGGVSENGCQHDEGGQNPFEPAVVGGTASSLSEYHDEWDALVLETYGKRNYTTTQDRLPGISGMAKRISELCEDEYLAGLWRADIPYALMWYAYANANADYHMEIHELVDRLCNPSPYITPSWSPMRLTGVRIERGLRYNTEPGFFRDEVSAECTLLEARAAPIGLNPFGTLQDGMLRLRGRLTRVPSDLHPLLCHLWPPRLLYVEDDGRTVAYCNIDFQPKGSVPQGELSMLLVASTGGSASWREMMHRENLESEHTCPCGDPSTRNDCDSDNISRTAREYTETREEMRRDAWGLLLHPTKKRGQYVRVGAWASVSGDGAGMDYFEQFESLDVDIV